MLSFPHVARRKPRAPTLLLYAVFRARIYELDMPLGVECGRLTTVCRDGLAAALSEISPSELPPTIARLKAYQRVIEILHRSRTLIPMRYGCTFATREQVVEHLKDRGEEYRTLLDGLGGCVEMGIRVLLPSLPATSRVRNVVAPGVTGGAYLAARRERYAVEDRAAAEEERVLKRICTGMENLFVRWRSERGSCSRGRLLSLYFLVPRDRVEPFRRTFRDLGMNGSAKLLLTGPWPPYNFVLGSGQPRKPGERGSEG